MKLMKLFEFMERMNDKEYQHKWTENIPRIMKSFIDDQMYICEKCKTTAPVQWSGGSCLLSDTEFIIKNLIE